jgi:hypothetical protein
MSTNPIVISTFLEKPLKRLFRQKRKLGSFHKLADARGVNVKWVYRFMVYGEIPPNKSIQRKLGIRIRHLKTINEHLATDSIQDMPVPLLAWALANRVEMK